MTAQNITVQIISRTVYAENIVLLELARPDGGDLPDFDAGAHIDVHITDDLIRQYSLCNAPSQKDIYRIGVLNDAHSRGGSKTIFQEFRVGQNITISKPHNLFPLDTTAPHSILMGGGIGITPMLSMAYSLKQQGKSFEIHYSCTSPEKAGFLDILETDFAPQTVLHFSVYGQTHRVCPTQVIAAAPDSSHVYVCGPQGFMDFVIQQAKHSGVPDTHIHLEYFNAAVDTGGDSFEVVAEVSGVTLQIPPDKSIVDVLIEAGIDIEKSCEQGICGTCLCDVLDGIPEHRDKFLTEQEQQDNDQIITCCSRAKTERLVLEI